MTFRIFESAQDFNVSLKSYFPAMALQTKLFMVHPQYFTVQNAINPHMLDNTGKPNQINKAEALNQWNALVNTYKNLGFVPSIVPGTKDLPDMVFCANQSLPFTSRIGTPSALLSNMQDDTRHKEVEAIANFLQSENITLFNPPARNENSKFEGMGDAIWVPGKRLLIGGYGPRTRKSSYAYVQAAVETDIALLELKNPRFYHLDTCFAVLNQKSALACKEAFTATGWNLLKTIFEDIIEVTTKEADGPYFACNAHCPDQKHVILQHGSTQTETLLTQRGFVPVPVETSEFIKSGGSVFCMKLMYF